MTYDEIMREITQGLTGDASVDMPYLKEQMEKYKNHEMAQEILRACGRLMYELIPADKKEELGKVIGNELKGVESTLDEIRYNVYKKNIARRFRMVFCPRPARYIKIKRNPVLFTSCTVTSPFWKMPARNIRSKHNKPAEQVLSVRRVKCYIMRK